MAPKKLHICNRKRSRMCWFTVDVMVLCSLFRGFELLTLGISIMSRGLGGILWGIVLPSWLLWWFRFNAIT